MRGAGEGQEIKVHSNRQSVIDTKVCIWGEALLAGTCRIDAVDLGAHSVTGINGTVNCFFSYSTNNYVKQAILFIIILIFCVAVTISWKCGSVVGKALLLIEKILALVVACLALQARSN